MLLASVWPDMITTSHHTLRGYENDVDIYCCWVIGDAYVLRDDDDTNGDTESEATWKGR